ncbi:MAG: hypothetical protein BGO49_04600 [Planctomycetales bacterium 71-10]|nr:MAG: hypothetical protein BGO49_04600 [Planctomycetales bacterium 71-10]
MAGSEGVGRNSRRSGAALAATALFGAMATIAAAQGLPPLDDAPNPAEARTRLVVVRPQKPGAAAIVALRKPTGPKTYAEGRDACQRLLQREIVRQAFLVAARDELGLATRDELLDDAPIPQGADDGLEFATDFRLLRSRLRVHKAGAGAGRLILKELPGPDSWRHPIELADAMGPMSRKEIVAAFRSIGLSGRPNAYKAQAPAPPGVEEALQTLDFVDVFAAVRALHETIRADGESPERLGALARAYAQLAALTCHVWSPSHRAFAARALLYTERFAAHEDAHATRPRWLRAFVASMIGIDASAAHDLQVAANLRGDRPGGPGPPAWVEVIEAGLRRDVARLNAIEGPHRKLARFLAMQATEFPWGRRRSTNGAVALLEVAPECDRAYDLIFLSGGMNDRHESTVAGPELFEARLPGRLAASKGLPPAVAAAIKADAGEARILAALAEAGGADPGEPSWGVLARTARDFRFLYTLRRVIFMYAMWGVPVDEYWAEVRGLVAGHRYVSVLEDIVDRRDGAAALQAFAADADWSDLEVSQIQMIDRLRRLQAPRAEDLWGFAVGHGSVSARDLALAVASRIDPSANALALIDLCPDDDFAAACLVGYDWEIAKGRLEGWNKRFAGSSVFLQALGLHHMDAKNYDEAIPLLERSLKIEPESDVYRNLAACRLEKGDEAGWKAALDSYLEDAEPIGLDHAQIQVQIAERLLSQGKAAEAKPYADAAAETWAGWAMTCAGRVDEALGEFESAENWNRQTSERYPEHSWDAWFRFCLRTGRGDLRGARALAEAQLARKGGRPVDPYAAGCFLWSVDRRREGLERLRESFAKGPTDYLALTLAGLAGQLGDRKAGDEALKWLAAGPPESSDFTKALALAFLDASARGEKAAPDPKAIDEAVAAAPASDRGDVSWFAYLLLRNRGLDAEARRRLAACKETPPRNNWPRAMAAEAVRKASKSP